MKKALLPISFFICLTLSSFLPSEAAEVSPKKKLSRIEKEIREKKKEVKEALKKEKSILGIIEDINSSLKKKEEEVTRYSRRISQTQAEISSLAKDVEQQKVKLDKSREHLKKRLKELHRQNFYGDSALILISSRDYDDLIKKSRYLSMTAQYDSRVVEKYMNDLNDLNFRKKKLEVLHDKLDSGRKMAGEKKNELQKERLRKDRLLATIKSKRSTYEKTIKELEESSNRLRDMIKKLEKEHVPLSVTGKGFRAYKGHLSWPINGNILVPFGEYKDPKFNIPIFRNGIEIGARTGEEPLSVFGGRVVFAGQFKGYGQLLIINHGNSYHSLYGNLAEIYPKTGEIIKSGDPLGKIGYSGLLNVPSLYFEIRYKGKPVNPTGWLKKSRN